MNQFTCGIYLVDGRKKLLLIGHVTGASSFSIPKGMLDEADDDTFSAAKRELFEETSIEYDDLMILHQEEFEPVDYKSMKKELHSWLVIFEPSDKIPEPYCISQFEDEKTGELKPELDYFLWVTIQDAYNYLSPVQQNHLPKIEKVLEGFQ